MIKKYINQFLFVAFISIFQFLTFSAKAQDFAPEEQLYDTLQFNKLSISGILLGTEYGKILEKFGAPDSVRKEENEIVEQSDFFDEYFYGKDVIYVANDTLVGFEMKSNKFILDKLDLKVGTSVNKIKKLFPLSYKNRDIDEFNPDWVTVSVQFGDSTSFLEIYLEEGKIKTISTITDDGEEE